MVLVEAMEKNMSVLPLVAEDSSEGVRQVFEEFRQDKSTSFVPNFFKTMANSPTAVRGTWDVYRQVGNRGVVPTALKEMIFVVISTARDCKYCESAHLAFCKVLGVDSETMASLVENLDLIRPIRLRDILKFSVTCALNPQGLTVQDYDNLRSHGLSSEEIVEIIAMCAFSMYATTFADATKIAIDDEFTAILRP
jgi:uncharacterized peroxidase-related enzyme